jgi:thioredoxin reductase
MVKDCEIAIVGGGPAGLSAALLLARCLRRVIICDAGNPRNFASAHIHGLLGQEGIAPPAFLSAAYRDLDRYAAVVREQVSIRSIRPKSNGFDLQADSAVYSAKKVLLATGLVDQVPDLPGVPELYGRSVHHCLYCDGFEHANKPLAAYGAGEKGAGLALMMRQWSPDIVLLTDGQDPPDAQMQRRLECEGIKIDERKIRHLQAENGCLSFIAFTDGTELAREGLFFCTGCKQGSDLADALGCARDEKGGICVDPLTEETSVPGLYVAGDASRDVLLVSVAIAEGAKAAVAINRALLKEGGLL